MDDFLVRELSINDLDLKGTFFKTLSRFNLGNLGQEQAIGIFNGMRNKKIFVVEVEGEIVATATAFFDQKFIHGGGRAGYIEEVATREDQQGHGYGVAVVTACIEYFRSMHCYKILLSCDPENVAYYTRQGFHVHEEGMRMDL